MNVHVAIPELFWPEPAPAPHTPGGPLAALEVLVSKGRRTAGRETDLEAWLLARWDVADAGAAPYALRADGGEPGDAYKDKFNPVWEPRYLAYPGGLGLPRFLADGSALVASRRILEDLPEVRGGRPVFMRATATRGVALSLLSAGIAVAGQASYTMNAPTFGTVTIYPAAGQPRQVVLFISGDGGWNLGVVPMAERLRDAGALVVGIDIRTFVKNLDASPSCSYPAGALEELSRAVQLHQKLPAYKRPILLGYSSGATLVYAALAAAPPEKFAGAISLGFCPDLEVRTPPCLMRGLKASKKQGCRVRARALPRLHRAVDDAAG